MNVKVWSTLATATLMGATTAVPQDAQADVSPYTGGTIEKQIEKMFEGEGGEGGLGMTKMVPGVLVPALRDDQLTKVLSGNTVRSNNRFAIYFSPNGSVDGWVVKYKPADGAACAAKKPAHFVDDDGTCLGGFEVPITGRWQVKDNMICMPGLFHGAREPVTKETCHYMTLILNGVVFFTDKGDLVGKSWDLAKGDVRAKKI